MKMNVLSPKCLPQQWVVLYGLDKTEARLFLDTLIINSFLIFFHIFGSQFYTVNLTIETQFLSLKAEAIIEAEESIETLT